METRVYYSFRILHNILKLFYFVNFCYISSCLGDVGSQCTSKSPFKVQRISYNMSLTDKMAKIVSASGEFAKDPNLRPTDVKHLREWLRKQPHLPQCITDEFLIAALHSSDCSLEQAKQLVETNITSRTDYEFFSNRDPLTKNNQAVWNCIDFWVGPQLTSEKYRVLFAGLNNYDPDYFNFSETLSVFVSVVDTTVAAEGVCPGYNIVVDCRGVALSHLAKASLSLIRDILNFVQDSILIKIKAIHLIYVSPVIDKIMFVIKPFMKKALLDIMHFHTGEMEGFYKSVPRSILPTNIGGTAGNHKDLIATTRNRMEEMSNWLIKQEELKLDENKRMDKKKDSHSMQGSFRKLALD